MVDGGIIYAWERDGRCEWVESSYLGYFLFLHSS